MIESILFSRFLRNLVKDVNVPINCYATTQNVIKGDRCDCKLWCKYPPNNGTSQLAYIRVEYKKPIYKKYL